MPTFTFKKSKEMKVQVSKEQAKEISTPADIKIACGYDVVIAFDIYLDETVIGFAMIEMVTRRTFFLWNYAIDSKYQNKGYGTEALRQLVALLRKEYKIWVLTTTYIWGNEHAKHVYEKVGFIETDVVDEPGVHEVNMKIRLIA